MKSKKQLLESWKVYPILDSGFFPDRKKLLKKFYELIESPVDVIQLRFEDFSDHALYRAAEAMVPLARKKKIPLLINDRPEIALSLGASGVHLGKGDVSARSARRLMGPDAIIGRTVRSFSDLAAINRRNADYVAIGPVFRTPIKPALRARSKSEVIELCRKAKLPVVGIGGINAGNVREVVKLGINTVAFVRYACGGNNAKKRMDALRKAMEMNVK
ncbi:MAG: thiamine phosphate synthase [Candidatus Omnitrophica bacterium]|nr:thiamine phosphate synthase [Candidatus Omnitrophota bacterium]